MAIRRKFQKLIHREKLALLILFVSFLSLLVIILKFENCNFQQVKLACQLTTNTLGDVGITLLLFMISILVLGIISALLVGHFGFWKVSVLWAFGFVGLIYLNSFPISYFIDRVQEMEISGFIHPTLLRSFSLVTSNAMLYFFGYMFITELVAESKKDYFVSAYFKEHKPVWYLKERASWIVYGSLTSLFYYMLSFHLFVEIQNQADEQMKIDGIMGALYTKALNEKPTGELAVYFLSMLIVVVVIKILIDSFLHQFEQKRNITDEW